ncbi:ATPase family associated with various cellular activities (AAA) [Acidithrix ferrooxidans]|uniref:ATPase family associated with various cellular activities (AAA) n=2 Tax=Acidithrix ferrooxidans TaxID=1280514 RepID=A0A0D8HLT1_9ACTN|nr:ATPase family associated with various cellular activities (AAA) [Acidithrix ferrooxidans]
MVRLDPDYIIFRKMQLNQDYISTGQEFKTIEMVDEALLGAKYLSNKTISTTVFLSIVLRKPILVEGPAGTGKTELAKALSSSLGAELIRLQCYEGLDDAKAIYEWNYSKQLLRIQSAQASGASAEWDEVKSDIFSSEFLLYRPLLKAIVTSAPAVLLIDEIDRVEVETEALFLELLSDFQVTIPEYGTISATRHPLVILTSNNTRELSEALKRRCLFLHIGYPDRDREKAILTMRVPGLSSALANSIADFLAMLRTLDLKKHPSISESLDWAITLMTLGATELEQPMVISTLNVLLKYQADIEKVLSKVS